MKFSFGRNWQSFSRFATEATVQEAQQDLVNWLGPAGITGKTVIDIGCGSGINSLGFYRLGAKSITSIDIDRDCVACTQAFWERAGKPGNWRVSEGDILDAVAMATLGHFDIVSGYHGSSVQNYRVESRDLIEPQ
jgi:ribosomal protein L11 methylase PrmA